MRNCFLAVVAAAGAIGANGWSVGGKVAGQPEGDHIRSVAVVTAEYALLDRLSWRTDLEASMRTLGSSDGLEISLPTHLLVHPLGQRRGIDPYAGPGLSYTYAGSGKHWFGADALAGLAFARPGGQKVGIEAKFSFPDLATPSKRRFQLGLVGSFDFRI